MCPWCPLPWIHSGGGGEGGGGEGMLKYFLFDTLISLFLLIYQFIDVLFLRTVYRSLTLKWCQKQSFDHHKVAC